MTWLCSNASPPLDPVQAFRQEVRKNFIGRLKGPFNADDRRKAGLDKEWYDDLVGEKESTYSMGVRRNEVLAVKHDEIAISSSAKSAL